MGKTEKKGGDKDMKGVSTVIGAIVLVSAIFFVVFAISAALLKFAWPWVIPDLFPGAVASGAIAHHLSWGTAFKAAIFISLFFAGSRSSSSS